MDEGKKTPVEPEVILSAETIVGQNESEEEPVNDSVHNSAHEEAPETNPELKELLYGDVGNLGIGTLAYTVPVKVGEDYRMYFFAAETGKSGNISLSDASYTFPDAREGNAAIGRFEEIYYMDVIDVSEDCVGDIFVVAVYEESGEECYDTRVYIGGGSGYSLDSGLTKKINEEYCHVNDYPVQDILFTLQ